MTNFTADRCEIEAASDVFIWGEAARVARMVLTAGSGATRKRLSCPRTEERTASGRIDVVSSSPSRPQPLCYVPRGGCLVETCTRTVHGRPLLRPGPEANERILGALGRAAEYYDVELFAFGIASSHYHLLYFAENGLQMARFQGHLNSNLARELGRLHDWREKFWSRRYRPMIVSDEPEAQRERLKYVLGTGTKEQLVARPLDWPGPNAARALVQGEPLVGYWFNRTKEWKARRRGEDFQKYDYATRYEIELQPLPGFADLSPEAYRAMVAEVLTEIEEEAAAKRGDRPVLGVEKILSEDPSRRPQKTKKSPAPMLFFASRKEVREAQANRYLDFVDEYELAADRLIQAALQGNRLDPSRHFPKGSFPPAVIEELMKAAGGFNPGREFPRGSFPRPWPFVGGRLRPAPPIPPTRQLVYRGPDDPKIVWRGEIPTVHVPRSDLLEVGTTAPGDPAVNPEPLAQTSLRLARDPP